MAQITAIVLAGGLGTRLRPYTYTIPKPLMPIGERPALEILIRSLVRGGVDRVTLCLGYLAPLVMAFIQSRTDWGCAIEFVVESERLGTAAPLRLVGDPPEHFVVVNGDTVTDLDFGALYRSHMERQAAVTVFSPQIEDQVEYGLLEIDPGTDVVTRYIEKPVRTLDVSSGVYAMSRAALRHIPPDGPFDMPDLIGAVLRTGEMVAAYRPRGVYWRDIGRQDHFEAANRDVHEHPERFPR